MKLVVVQLVTSETQLYVVQHASPLSIPVLNIFHTHAYTQAHKIDTHVHEIIQFVYHFRVDEVGTADNHC